MQVTAGGARKRAAAAGDANLAWLNNAAAIR